MIFHILTIFEYFFKITMNFKIEFQIFKILENLKKMHKKFKNNVSNFKTPQHH